MAFAERTHDRRAGWNVLTARPRKPELATSDCHCPASDDAAVAWSERLPESIGAVRGGVALVSPSITCRADRGLAAYVETAEALSHDLVNA
jgi:hypothetical protein